jgi:hypothetical protein
MAGAAGAAVGGAAAAGALVESVDGCPQAAARTRQAIVIGRIIILFDLLLRLCSPAL